MTKKRGYLAHSKALLVVSTAGWENPKAFEVKQKGIKYAGVKLKTILS